MKIGIDCRTILNPGFGEQAGVGHYTYFLVSHLLQLDRKNEYVLFFDRNFSEASARELVGGRTKTEIRFFPFHAYKHLLPFVYSHLLITSFIAREKCDIFHSPSGHLPYRYTASSVITIHDLAILRHPEWFPERALERYSATRVLLPRAVRLARKIIVPSEATRRDVLEFFSLKDGLVTVIPHGVLPHAAKMDAQEVRVKYKLPERYLLFLGTIEPRKNLAVLVRAFRSLAKEPEFSDVVLVLAGQKGWKYEDVFEEITKTEEECAPKNPIRVLGYVPADDKFALMKHARAFVFPSLYEGFGLPVLEAMRVGVPVIASAVSALPEVVGDAGILIDPANEIGLREAMRQILTDDGLRADLSRRGAQRAAEFTWTRSAEMTMEVYESVIE